MRINIHHKITITLIIIIALVLSGIYLYLNTNLKKHAYQRIKHSLLKQTQIARLSFEKEFSKDVKPDTLADEIGNELELRVTIIDLNGTVLGDSELDGKQLADMENHLYRPEIQQALSFGVGESRRFSATIKKEMLYIASMAGKNKPLGLIRLAIPLSEIALLSSHLKRLLTVSLMFAFVMAIIITFIVSIFISRPIKEISSIANSIAEGDFSRNICISAHDEIGDLAKAFKYMIEQIQSRIEEITVSKSRFEAVLLSMFEGVMVVDPEGTILLMNQRLKNFLLVHDDPIGKKPLEVIRNSAAQEIVDHSLLLKHSVDFHDITELRHLEDVRRDFVANVSHELRTPITSIKGYAETLLDGALKDEKNAYNFLKIIYSDTERVSLLIDDLLDLTQIESGKLPLTFKSCSALTIVKQVISSFNKKALDNFVAIHTDIPEDLPPILADEMRITQVLQNLIDNAIKYNRKNGTVTVSAAEKNIVVQIDVSDTGVGIPEKDIPRLFERFYRADKAHSGDLEGTGLGLSIVKHIVQAHNGQIFVQSMHGCGSTFSFTIPKAELKKNGLDRGKGYKPWGVL